MLIGRGGRCPPSQTLPLARKRLSLEINPTARQPMLKDSLQGMAEDGGTRSNHGKPLRPQHTTSGGRG